jgi:hypothetical protein
MLQVIWSQGAVNDLAEIWNEGDSALRQEITRAANTIDQTLRDDPFGSSESREEPLRVMFAPPLGVSFRVDQDSGMVLVGHIWRMQPRRRRT